MRLGPVLALVVWAGAGAAEVPGQSDPGFAPALSGWLAGDEAQALPAVSALAAKGNTAAQLLLGVIDTTPVLQGDWLMAQSRADRLALMRPPGGLSGGNWLRVAAAAEPIAAAWAALWDGDATPQVVMDFANLNEPRAARVAGLALAARQVKGLAALETAPGFPGGLRGIAVREAGGAAAALDPGDPGLQALGAEPDPAALADWLAAQPEGDPLLAFCQARCPEEMPAACLPAAFVAVGGYYGLMRMGAPVEALVTSADFNRSPQGLQTTLRRMQQWQLALGSLTPPEGSACITDLLK